MQSKRRVAVIVAAVIAAGSAMTIAAQEKPDQAPGGTPDTKQMPMDRGMMGRGMGNGMMGQDGMGGMMGMMNMMNQCSRMMSSGMGGGMMGGMLQLPPGNEKLQVQMQAEIMQKVGEIVAKYAARAKEPPR
ncbi:MAG TPA: hypothetical protein VNL39_05960 [Xanthobacteraceae bacterium]|nr:hypothetical protein [Xanthobacteraceae bacterium]